MADGPAKDAAESTLAPIPQRHRARWLLRGILAVPIVFLVAGGVLWWTHGRVVARKLEAIRARGEPVTAADLEAYYVRPDADKDATSLWITAGTRLSAAARLAVGGQPTPVAKLPFLGKGPDPELPGQPWTELPIAVQFLKNNAADMQLLHEAAAIGGAARYPTDFSKGITMLSQEVQNLRTCARCLALQAMVRAHQGDAKGAMDSLRAIQALAQSLDNDPAMLSQQIRMAIQGMMDRQLQELLPVIEFPDANLAQLENVLLASDYQPALHRALLGERVAGLIMLENPNGMGNGPATRFAQGIIFGRDRVAYLDVMVDYIAATDQPWPAVIVDSTNVSVEFMARTNRFTALTSTVVPAVDGMVQSMANGTARCRVTALAIALERYRRANGKPPATLDELAPQCIKQVPLDPYSGQSFTYQATDAGYVVYSLGGNKDPNSTDSETGAREDLLFRWPPKPKPATVADDGNEQAPGPDTSTPVQDEAAPAIILSDDPCKSAPLSPP